MALPPSPTAATRKMDAVLQALLIWLLVWSALTAVLWATGWGEVSTARWVARQFGTGEWGPEQPLSPLAKALTTLVRLVDIVWVVVAAVTVYLHTVRTEGLKVARRWFALTMGVGAVLMAASVWIGLPLGMVRYTERLGMRVGPVSLGAVLLWPIIVLGARELVLRCWAQLSHRGVAVATGLLALGTALNLDPVAVRLRAWWLWYAGRVPVAEGVAWQSALGWGLAAAALAYALRQQVVARGRATGATLPRATAIFVVLNALCLLAQAGARWRG